MSLIESKVSLLNKSNSLEFTSKGLNTILMGFHISGFALNECLKDKEESLKEILGLELEFEREINFETALENWKDEGVIDVYFGKEFTLIFVHENSCTFKNCFYNEADVSIFSVHDISSTYVFEHRQNELMINGNESLEIDYTEDDCSERIWNEVSKFIGYSFWNIDPSGFAIRFSVKTQTYKSNKKNSFSLFNFRKNSYLIPFNEKNLKNKYSKSKLLKLFDKMIKHAQRNSVNVFLQPNYFIGLQKTFMLNLIEIKKAITQYDDLLIQVNQKMPANTFRIIGNIQEEQIDEKTKLELFALISRIEPVYDKRKFKIL